MTTDGTSSTPRSRFIKPIPPLAPKAMTQVERLYKTRLEILEASGEINAWHFEPFKIRLAADCFYTPDFLVVFPDHFRFVEVKGPWIEEDGRIKFKIAAERYPWMEWVLAQLGRDNTWRTYVYPERLPGNPPRISQTTGYRRGRRASRQGASTKGRQ